MSLADLERRIQILEDAGAIRNLKAQYAAYCDDNYDADKIAELFVEDAHWESTGLGRFEGREAIREFFRGPQKSSRLPYTTASIPTSRSRVIQPAPDGLL